MATTPVKDSEATLGLRPYRMTIPTYERLAASGVYSHRYPIFLWEGKLVEKIREGFKPTADGEFPEHLITVDRFVNLVDAGVFPREDRVFLWQGRLVEKMGKGRPHVVAQLSLADLLQDLLLHEYHIEIEAPLAVDDVSLPEPDLAVIRGSVRDYPNRPPTARDSALVIEVADSSLAIDSVTKLKVSAGVNIPVYWIVNILNRRIEVYAHPSGPVENPSYGEYHEYGPDDEVPVVLDGREVGRIAVRDVLP